MTTKSILIGEHDDDGNIKIISTPKKVAFVTAKGIISDSQKREVDVQYHRPRRSKVGQFGFDTNIPIEVKTGYTE